MTGQRRPEHPVNSLLLAAFIVGVCALGTLVAGCLTGVIIMIMS